MRDEGPTTDYTDSADGVGIRPDAPHWSVSSLQSAVAPRGYSFVTMPDTVQDQF